MDDALQVKATWSLFAVEAEWKALLEMLAACTVHRAVLVRCSGYVPKPPLCFPAVGGQGHPLENV